MLKVLLVDDELIVRAAFQKIIPWEAEGFEVVGTASNGQEALRLLRQRPADVVITDLKMPQMDGIALIKQLRAEGFDGVILVLSNYSDFELVREALLAGAMDYMLKVNIDAGNLTEKMRQAREALQSRHRERSQQKLVAEHGALVRAHELRAYLAANGAEPDSAPGPLLDAFSSGPFGLCHVSFLSPPPLSAARLPSAQHVEAVLRAIFEDVRGADVLILTDRSLLCVWPAESFLAKGARPEGKLDQIARQINMYFNAPVLILTAPPVDGLPAIRACCAAMGRASALSFYALPPAVVPLDQAQFGALPDGFSPGAVAERLAGAHFMNEGGAVESAVAEFLGACRERRASPPGAAGFLMDVARNLLAFAPSHAQADELMRGASDWAACPSEQELFQRSTQLFGAVLEQIVPPAYQHCRAEVRTALLHLHIHFRERVTLDSVARATSLDRSYLCRLFKRETGTNLFAYLNALRMNAAARQIEKGDAYIRDIAQSVGIDDPFYFARLFKKHFGVSPSEYGQG